MMSRPPNRSTAAATSASTSSALVTSQRTASGDVVAAELLGGGFGRGEIEIAEHHPRTLGDEPLGDREAQALRTAGDDRGLTGQQ